MTLSSLQPRSRLVVELVLVLILSTPAAILLWPAAMELRSILPIGLLLFIIGSLSLRPLARYGRAIGKPLIFDGVLDFSPTPRRGPDT
jgi:hypothetical protein